MTIRVVETIAVDNSGNVILGRLSADLGNASSGAVFFNSNLGVVRARTGTQWVSLTQGASVTEARSWGSNAGGQLGDGTTTNRSSPVSVFGSFTNWVQVSAGNLHSVGIRSNGQAWAWGTNTSGQLGDASTTARFSPVSVVGGFTDWSQVSAGRGNFCVGLRNNGQAWAWGLNSTGQLGDNTVSTRSSPVSVVGGITDWVQITAGDSFCVGIRSNGLALSWGNNANGRLGNGSTATTTNPSPISVVGGFTNWIQVSSGISHTVGIRANGQAWSWGANANGQLGNSSTISRGSPVSVANGFTNWIQVSAGSNHTVGIRANGQAWAWGGNAVGQIGDGTTTTRTAPVLVVGGFTDWVGITTGTNFTIGVRSNGQAWSWGTNVNGELGRGNTSSHSSPVSVVGGFTDWIQVLGGVSHSVGIRATTI